MPTNLPFLQPAASQLIVAASLAELSDKYGLNAAITLIPKPRQIKHWSNYKNSNAPMVGSPAIQARKMPTRS
jgi:hypothetical protein